MQDKTDIFLDFMNYKILRQILTSMESDYFLSFLRVLEYYHLRTVHAFWSVHDRSSPVRQIKLSEFLPRFSRFCVPIHRHK
jgi:hypothetical protein